MPSIVDLSEPEQQSSPLVLRGDILYFTSDPVDDGERSYRYIENGALAIADDKVQRVGEWETISPLLSPATEVIDYSDHLILPGFIDSHIHYPQTDIIASYGEHLLEWLQKFTFPAEQAFSDVGHARSTADFFLDQLLRNGTTTAGVYATVHPQSVDAFFAASHQRNMRMICGKVMMDRNAPPALCDTPVSSYQDSKALIERWHHCGRQLYGLTPRFTITSSPEQLTMAGDLLQEFPDVWVQSHIAEDSSELARVAELFPAAKHYLDVYDQAGLLSPRTVLAHGIYLSADELARLAETGAGIAFCPTSNLFLGSGLLDLKGMIEAGVSLSLATDVGAGTSFSMLQTMAAAYKIASLTGYPWSPLQAFYQATLGNARTLRLEPLIGTFQPGSEADVVVLNKRATPLLSRRISCCSSLEEMLFVLMMLGGEQATKATWVNGHCLYEQL